MHLHPLLNLVGRSSKVSSMKALDMQWPFLVGMFVLGTSAPAIAQTSCTIPAPPDHETHLIWGGETRHVFMQQFVDGVHIHTAEDGGRIRRSLDGGATWTFASSPADATQGLLDVWFTDDGSKGYACGRGGRILKSTD